MTQLTASHRREALESQFPAWPRRTLATHFSVQCSKYADRPMLMMPERVYSYREVWEQARRCGKALMAEGVRPREHVAVLMANEAEHVFTVLGAWMIGAVCIPLNTMLREDELLYMLRQSDSRYLVMHQQAMGVNHGDTIGRLYGELTQGQDAKLVRVVCVQNGDRPMASEFVAWHEFLTHGETVSDEELDARWHASEYPEDVANIIYTSGSTGQPKGVIITHDMLLRCGYSSALSRAFEDGRRVFTALPIYHVFALVEGIMTVSFVGGAFATDYSFAPLRALELMQKHRVNDVLCVPSMLVALLNHPDVGKFDLNPLYAMMCAAAPAPIPVWERAIQTFGLTEICTAYGGTEATAATVHTEVGDALDTVVETVGRLKPGGSSGIPEFGGANIQYKVVDPFTGEDLPAHSVGELTVRGNIITKGYYKKPEETAAVIDKDGWFRSGDLGRIDENGYIQLLGRSKDMYKVSGENVAPKEVEDVINRLPAISQAYVVGVPDPITTEIGAVFIELKPGQTLTRREVIQYCQERLAKFKVPRHVWFVEPREWPMTGTGKIQKFKLQEIAAKRLEDRYTDEDAM